MNHENVKAEFATRIRSLRAGRGYSQEQLAERADLHRTYISDIERAARNPSLESISKLAEALEVPLPTLFSPAKSEAAKSSNGNAIKQFVDVLLVEDNPYDVELALDAFKKARFANQVHVVHDGGEALDYVYCRGLYAQRVDKRPQLILLDLDLPKISGLDVLRRIKADSRTRTIPVIVLTGSRQDRDVAESKRLGAETYVVKPLDFLRLSQATPQLNLNWALLKPADTNQPAVQARVY